MNIYHLRKLISGSIIGRPSEERYATMSENLMGSKTHIEHNGKIMPIPEKAFTYRFQKGVGGMPDHRLGYFLWQPQGE
jgi:hypothetical protein